MKHIIWDWNGTLLNDTEAVVGATNAVFADAGYGLDLLTVDAYRASYTRPIWVSYARMLGRELLDGEWERLDVGFHRHYHRLMTACDLATDARDVLQAWRDADGTQSLLSMSRHEHLVPTVQGFGITPFFTGIDGLRGAGGGHKAEHMAAHVAALGLDPGEVLVVGDTVDDAVAAAHIGARAVVYTGGLTSRADLEAVGVPVADTLTQALDWA